MRQGCEKRRPPQQVIHSKRCSQLLGKCPSSAPLCEETSAWVEAYLRFRPFVSAYPQRRPGSTGSDKPTLTFALQRWEVALRPATLGILRHVQRVPAELAIQHASHGRVGRSPGSAGEAWMSRESMPRNLFLVCCLKIPLAGVAQAGVAQAGVAQAGVA
eukprot:scaffold46716_cov72-Phaeocystis_antarctica.AAC.8